MKQLDTASVFRNIMQSTSIYLKQLGHATDSFNLTCV